MKNFWDVNLLHREKLSSRKSSIAFISRDSILDNVKTLPDGTKEVIFSPLELYETPEAVASLCEAFKNELSKGIVDPLILIPCFILDFLCIHPFNDGKVTLRYQQNVA